MTGKQLLFVLDDNIKNQNHQHLKTITHLLSIVFLFFVSF